MFPLIFKQKSSKAESGSGQILRSSLSKWGGYCVSRAVSKLTWRTSDTWLGHVISHTLALWKDLDQILGEQRIYPGMRSKVATIQSRHIT